MKKLTLFLGSIPFGLTVYSQGLETFDNFVENSTNASSYYDGTFTGQDGSTWTFLQCRGDSVAEITTGNQGLMLGRNKNSTLTSGTLHNGIATLEFSYMQAFSNNVGLEVYINGNLVYTATTTSEVGVAKTTGVIDLSVNNIMGNFVLGFVNPSGAGQVNIDDVTWTPFAATTCADPTNIVIDHIFDAISVQVTWTAGGSETEWVIIYGPKNFNPVTDLGNPGVFSDTVSSNSYFISGLTEHTDYDVYVKTKCDSSDFSNIVGPETFNSGSVSVEEETFGHFTFYPNPVHDQLSLKARVQIESVVVYDLLGKIVISVQPNTMNTQINTKDLQNGVYLIKVTLNGNQETYRLVKK